MNNPFEILSAQLNRIENRLGEIDTYIQRNKTDQLNNSENEFLEIDAAAVLLHMARQTVYAKCSKGILPYIKRGRKLLFERKRLLQFMQEGRKETIADAEDKINQKIIGRKK